MPHSEHPGIALQSHAPELVGIRHAPNSGRNAYIAFLFRNYLPVRQRSLLEMAKREILAHKPGMMTLISLAITIALFHSLAVLFLRESGTFFWELVTLIDVMLLEGIK